MFFPTKTLLVLAAAFAVAHAEDPGSAERGFGGFRTPTTTAPAPTSAPTQSPVATPDSSPTVDDTSNVKGDPHFQTFGEEKFDYHGECDLVLLKNPLFKNMGMEVHIRTKITDWWSAVEAAAIKLGEEVLEVNAGNVDQWLWINGKPNEELEDSKYYSAWINGMQIRYQRKGVNREVNIYLEGRPERLQIRVYKDFVRVDVDHKVNPEHYKGAIGLLGSFDLNGKRVGRDGQTKVADHNEFGQEWQVRDEDPKLFHSYEGAVVAPNKCKLPELTREDVEGELLAKSMLRKRRLNGGLSKDAIERACAHVPEGEREDCIYDVTATQDVGMASVF
ncbi:expressed unknown protein [Seminavis robusta]|uniref:VWFD domain-containing protein n=1 Tax=Seminavis robusta TaxID=568900 RepID=A0A9N8EDS7_9STRA|nr:expressed unknown protein [Seminavis robusta]|eukprot:Sro1005_g230231.1  (333) ;mRNA; f:16518-17516